MGLQVFIGSTGILSFGHLAFAQTRGLRRRARRRSRRPRRRRACPTCRSDSATSSSAPFGAVVVGVVVAVAVGALVGVAVARAGGLAATMITLAVLFVVDQVVKNWTELTRGAGGLSGVPRMTTNTWLWVAALGGADRRQLVPRDPSGALRRRRRVRTRSLRRPSASTASRPAARRGWSASSSSPSPERCASRWSAARTPTVHARRRRPAAGDARRRRDAHRHRCVRRAPR